jgi:site-specific DNA-cytosine methylase
VRWLDLFAGCGGASLGLEAAGAEVVAAYDFDGRACRAHRALLPHVEVHEADLNTLDPATLPEADGWWASPPCQPGSTAGLRQGCKDPRDGYPALLRLVRARRPRWLVIENVPGFAQHRSAAGCGALWPRPEECPACYLAEILRCLDELFPVVRMVTLDAADHGVPQHRDRLITVCGPALVDWPAPTHGPGRPLPWVTSGEVLGLQVLGGGTNPHGPGAEHERTFRDLTAEPSTTIAASPAGNGGPFVIEYGGTRGDRGQGYVGTDRPAPVVGTAGDLRLALSVGGPNARGGQGPSVTGLEDPGPTVRTHADCYLVEGPEYRRIRTLTVEERARLQSLPWHPTLTGRTVGNAVPPPLAAAVVRQVLAVEARR